MTNYSLFNPHRVKLTRGRRNAYDDWYNVKRSFKVKNCQICMDDGELHLHHIFYKWGKPDGDDNLITLCRHCHFHIHFNKEGLRTKETTWRQRMYELMDRFAKDGYLWEHQISSMV